MGKKRKFIRVQRSRIKRERWEKDLRQIKQEVNYGMVAENQG